MPCRSTVTTTIEEKYSQCVGAVLKMLSNANDVAFTCDAVTISNSSRSFLTITAHFIEKDSLNSICLAALRMNQSHTSEYVNTLLEEACAEFNIDKMKWTTLTTDSASNMKCAAKLFLGLNKHVPCFAHSINLVVDETIKEICSFSSIVDKIKRVVMQFKHSPAMMDQLRKAQTDEGIPEGKIKTLIQNVDTRWNSCLDMMESFLGLANKVALILLNKSERVKGLPEMLNVSELTICRDLCSLLQPFKKATEQISGENYVTISDVPKPEDVFDDFMSAHNNSITKELSGVSEQNKELKLYFSLPQASWECNPLEVWKSHRATMPGLYKMAMRHLITPGSSVPSERLASAIKCVVCDARSRMTDIHIKQRVFLKSLNSDNWDLC
ncbi:zinc finger BED domain-containing protein 4-like isoform X2 [Drosophila nasuta]|uniref:zinc finger BED domain-containing protein 4-like isoform X2 n=1 Tax=Drosophila nasuta TaxID=42062 RepID=UPI00295E55B8|nr:zinc finger BED domain-containing protein 4-like isoform X2 [Drosophila nasuta]